MVDKVESIFKEIESMRGTSVLKYGLVLDEKNNCLIMGELKKKKKNDSKGLVLHV